MLAIDFKSSVMILEDLLTELVRQAFVSGLRVELVGKAPVSRWLETFPSPARPIDFDGILSPKVRFAWLPGNNSDSHQGILITHSQMHEGCHEDQSTTELGHLFGHGRRLV